MKDEFRIVEALISNIPTAPPKLASFLVKAESRISAVSPFNTNTAPPVPLVAVFSVKDEFRIVGALISNIFTAPPERASFLVKVESRISRVSPFSTETAAPSPNTAVFSVKDEFRIVVALIKLENTAPPENVAVFLVKVESRISRVSPITTDTAPPFEKAVFSVKDEFRMSTELFVPLLYRAPAFIPLFIRKSVESMNTDTKPSLTDPPPIRRTAPPSPVALLLENSLATIEIVEFADASMLIAPPQQSSERGRERSTPVLLVKTDECTSKVELSSPGASLLKEPMKKTPFTKSRNSQASTRTMLPLPSASGADSTSGTTSVMFDITSTASEKMMLSRASALAPPLVSIRKPPDGVVLVTRHERVSTGRGGGGNIGGGEVGGGGVGG